MFCQSCGIEYNHRVNYCGSCGADMNPTTNTVEVHLPPPKVGGMFGIIALFSFLGLIVSTLLLIMGLIAPFNRHREEDTILFTASAVCLAFTLLITLILSWQLGRLTRAFKNAVRQTIKNKQFEAQIPPQPALPQQQPLFVPIPRGPVSTVTENTTRSLNSTLETGPATER